MLRFNLGPLDNNTYVVTDSGEALVIDPTFDSASIIPEIELRELRVTAVLNTHAHIDHVVENALFVNRFAAPLGLHEKDLPLLKAMDIQASWMGIPSPRPCDPAFFLRERESIALGTRDLKIVHTPGHSPGHVTILGDDFCIVGDVLFRDSVGRTDLPGGSTDALMESIHSRLLLLPDSTIVYPGHGETTTIGRERALNPFLQSV